MEDIIHSLLQGDNNPSEGQITFDSSDHIRFQNGQNVSGHNMGCHRRFVIERNIEGNQGYTITLYNMDGMHPLWQNNIQMAPKQMKIENVENNVVALRGFGFDQNALTMGAPLEMASYSNYGILLLIDNDSINRVQLNMYDRNVSIIYLK